MSQSASSTLVFLSSKSPWTASGVAACLDALMTAAVFDVPVSFILHADGVFQLLRHQDGAALEAKTLAKMFGALGLYGISTIYVEQQSLAERGLGMDDLIDFAEPDMAEAPLQIEVVAADKVAGLIANSKAVFNF